MQAQNPFAIFWDKVQFELSISSEQTAHQNINNFIDLIFDMKISVPEQSIQWQMKQGKTKVKKERK